MERKISFDELRKAVVEAYENYKSENGGEVDPRLEEVDCKDFGISMMLTDGTVINKGDVNKKFALGGIAKMLAHVVLLQQNSVDQLLDKSGFIKGKMCKPKDLGVSAHGVRAVSAIEPTGDADGKWDVIMSTMLNMLGDSEPELDDKLYEKLVADELKANVEDKIAQAEFSLYDDAQTAIKSYLKLKSMKVDAVQLATIGATIAADGRNPKTGEPAFDGTLAASIVTLMAINGPHHRSIPWIMQTGLPAKSSFSGAIVAIMPGLGAIAAYSPKICVDCGISIKAMKAIRYIANKLQLNVFASARVEVEK